MVCMTKVVPMRLMRRSDQPGQDDLAAQRMRLAEIVAAFARQSLRKVIDQQGAQLGRIGQGGRQQRLLERDLA